MDSPRGRIVLMRVGHEDGASVSAEMVTHFDRCLGCMACVTACPSGVQYDKLIEQTRPQIERHADRPLAQRALPARDLRALHPPRPAARAGAGARAPAALRAERRARASCRSPSCGRCSGSRPTCRRARRSVSSPRSRPRRGEPRGRIALMQGCVQRVFFGDVNAATVRVLAAEGFEVHAPAHAALLRLADDARGARGGGARARPRDDRRLRGLRRRSRSTSRAAARA